MSGQNLSQTTTVQERGYKRELLWFAPALLAACSILYVYLRSHQYPSFGAGLYLLIAERIVENGYALPKTIPHYTAEGVPFSYPPLMFYTVAVIRDLTGIEGITIARYLPGLVSIAYLVPLYLFARDFLRSRPQASLATLIVAVSPPLLQWHISAGGIVRAPAFLFSLSGIYAGLRLYRDKDARWVVPSLALFTLTILTHPVYTVFFATSYFLLYLELDRSLWGLTRGMVVGFGGILLASPWWLQIISMHGPDVFLGAAGTHGGIGGGFFGAVSAIGHVSPDAAFIGSLWQFLPVVGALYLLAKRRFFLPVWFFGVAILLGKARFTLLVGALISAVFLLNVVAARLRDRVGASVTRRSAVTACMVLIAMVGLAGGAMYATSGVDAHAGSPSLPQFMDEDDDEAMQWVETHTNSEATFVVQGDAAEWFPQQTHRTMLVGPWGVEWKGQEPYNHHLQLFRDVSACNSAHCMTNTLSQSNKHPDYIYLPKGEFTVRGMQHRRTSKLAMSMHLSPKYQLVFENDGVLIFEMMDEQGERGTQSALSGEKRSSSADNEQFTAELDRYPNEEEPEVETIPPRAANADKPVPEPASPEMNVS
ncbi:ArnT family glycosyltransferase [Halorussus halophilus]|uniref:ArnT family glycosyltransferase n=1 Tax=Halorussus halophilus TaxID=2650975 RepID=UPI001787DE3E|nr:glycosyltransferase family 39 protein [Halorussus halophilus]